MFHNVLQFLGDRQGSYAPLFAVALVPIMGATAASVEYSTVLQTRAYLQHALDAAALATAKELAVSGDETYLETYSRDFFDANLSDDLDPTKITYTFAYDSANTGANQITLSARYDYDTYMAGVIGVDRIDLDVAATVAAGNRTVEVAIVVDNSGSMNTTTGGTSQTRMDAAKIAATNLINSLHTVAALSNKPDPVKVAIIPFAGSVNVGAKYRGADWLDMNGWSSTHHENFDWLGTSTDGDPWPNAYASGDGWRSPTTTTTSVGPNPPDPLPSGITSYDSTWLTRWTLFDALSEDWAGCVEMRAGAYHATDDAPDDLTPDTLFVPMFAPDESDYLSDEDRDYKNNYLNDFRRSGTDVTPTSSNAYNYTNQYDREMWAAKYNASAIWDSSEINGSLRNHLMGSNRSRDYGDHGPNQGCTSQPLQELTADATTATNAVASMEGAGFTNIQSGLVWGWHTLSSTSPFTEGRAYTVPENDKYIILLTDGNNTFPSQNTRNDTEYQAWGYGATDRIQDGLSSWQSYVNAMNAHTRTTCDNIKAITDADNEAAIKIFTIAYDVADGSSVKALLYDCASVDRKGDKYYYDVEGNAIADAMAAIGNEISELRIAR